MHVLPPQGPVDTALLLALLITQHLWPHGRGAPQPALPWAVPKLLVGYRLRSRSVSLDTLLRSTSFLLRNPLSCRTSSSSAGHGAPSSSSCGKSCFQFCPPCGRAPGSACMVDPERRGDHRLGHPSPDPASPCPPHQGCYLPAPPSGSPASQGAGEKERKQREDSKKEAAGRGAPKGKEAQKCYAEFI